MKKTIIMLLIASMLPITVYAADEPKLFKFSPETEEKLEAIRNGEWGRDENFLSYLAEVYEDNKALSFVSRNDNLIFYGAGTLGLTYYFITAQPNKAKRGQAAGRILSQLKKLF